MDPELKRRLDRIDKMLSLLLQAQKRESKTRVKVSHVMAATGWTKEQMRSARDNGLIEYRKQDNGFFYLLESIPKMFLKINSDAKEDI